MAVKSSIFLSKNAWEARKFSDVTSSFLGIPSAADAPQNLRADPFNKLTSVFHASVLLLIMNFVITLSK